MKSHSISSKTTTRHAGISMPSRDAPERAVSCLPPEYGVDFVDRSIPAGPPPVQRVAPPAAGNGQQNASVPATSNRTGLPDRLKAGIESFSGLSLDGVKVHYNSSRPTQFGALAYAQGRDIHVAPGEERHLPHEAWHVVQQAQGRVKPTMQLKEGVPANDDEELEHEADLMGAMASASALQMKTASGTAASEARPAEFSRTIQFGRRNRNRNKGGVHKAKWLREYEAKVLAVKDFMETQVAPWATQARIAELINENMADLRDDPSVSAELTYLRPHAHRRFDPDYIPQIAPGEAELLAPSRGPGRIEGTTSVIHRGDLEIELHEGVAHVRVYSALWAEARENKEGEITHKDIHQDPFTGKITVHTGRDQSAEVDHEEDERNPIMWVSGGQPLRQLKWFYKYPLEKYNPGAKPVVRSFLVPLTVWNEMSSQAVNEESARQEGNQNRPFNVDTAYGANQFGVRGPMLERIRGAAVDRSLISYVGDPAHSLPKYGGKVVGIKRLHQKLGAPLTKAPLPVWVDPEAGKFVRTAKQQSLANSLMFYYGVWRGNEEFIPEDKRRVPKERRHAILKEFLDENGLELPESYRLP